jgi:hypothetical protein
MLYLQKCVIENIIRRLFTRSLDELAGEEKTNRIKHTETIQSFINTIALGDEEKPGHCKCPIKNGNEVGDYSFSDGQAKTIEEKLASIIEKALLLEESRKYDWIELVKIMSWILTTFCQQEDFTDDQIIIFGLQIEEWTVKWISLVGKDGITNYSHCFTSGHIVYYLKYWCNIYHYSNHGLQYFNSQYSYVYCQRIKKSVFSGTHGEAELKMKPICF